GTGPRPGWRRSPPPLPWRRSRSGSSPARASRRRGASGSWVHSVWSRWASGGPGRSRSAGRSLRCNLSRGVRVSSRLGPSSERLSRSVSSGESSRRAVPAARRLGRGSDHPSPPHPMASSATIALRPASVADLELLRRWDEQPHVVASDPNDDWEWETELARSPDWREQLIAELDGRPVGFVQIIDPAREESRY